MATSGQCKESKEELFVECKGSEVFRSGEGPFVATFGVADLIVLCSEKAVFIINKKEVFGEDIQKIKEMFRAEGPVEEMIRKLASKYLNPPPW